MDLAVASRLSHQVLIASADLAKATEVAVGDPGLHGSTRAQLYQQREMQGEEIRLISPDAGLGGKVMPIPQQMCEPLRRSSADVIDATERVASLAMVAHPPGPSPMKPSKTMNQRFIESVNGRRVDAWCSTSSG